MKSFDTIRFAVRKGIAEITLHRPDVLNAMTSGTLIELLAVFSERTVNFDGRERRFLPIGTAKTVALLVRLEC